MLIFSFFLASFLFPFYFFLTNSQVNMDMMAKSKRSEQESSVGSDEMEMGERKRAPCSCSSYYIVTFATSSTSNFPLLKAWHWVEKKGVGCILELNADLEFSQHDL